ncbi:MAG: hypothetical protein EU529_17015 [Promethearchaeota archaeon]|nr:MAG: hypothetical protein EU529_17015 [Candidatus Lokiarchaeota archaeon]
MVNITLSIPQGLKKEMEKFPEINWSEIARSSIKQKIIELNFLKELTMDSELTPEEAAKMGQEVNILLAKRYKVEK